MKCVKCNKQACFSIEVEGYSNGNYGMRSIEWAYLCKNHYEETSRLSSRHLKDWLLNKLTREEIKDLGLKVKQE